MTTGKGIDLEKIPSILAIPISDYLRESGSPAARLWHASNVIELALRVVVILGISELLETGHLPPELLRELDGRIESPTLGKWRGMAQAVVQSLDTRTSLFPELRHLVDAVLVPLLDGTVPEKERTPSNSFSKLRNHLAHGGALNRKQGERLAEVWQAPIDTAIQALSWLADIQFIVRKREGGYAVLLGPDSQSIPLPEPDPEVAASVSAVLKRSHGAVVIRHGKVLDLWPLALFGCPQGQDPHATPSQIEVPQLYLRQEPGVLHYLPVGSEEVCVATGDELGLLAFESLFLLPPLPISQTHKFEVPGFEGELRCEGAHLVGRAEILETLENQLSTVEGGVIWLSGPPGMGKSTLMARLATGLLEDPPENRLVLAYRFKHAHEGCNRKSFLRYAIERLKAWEISRGQSFTQGQKKPPLDEFLELISNLGDGRVLFLLDGLDEIAGHDPTFAREIPLATAFQGVTWMCAGRPESGLLEAFSSDRCVFRMDLPPMSDGEIRGMFIEKMGALSKKVFSTDRFDGDQVRNRFIDQVAKNACGLPLYVALAIGDVLSNKYARLSEQDARDLPENLSGYYERIIQRLGVGDLQALLTPLLVTLSLAKAPLDAKELFALLVQRKVLIEDEESSELLQKGLSAIGTLVKRNINSDWGAGYSLYHEAFRQHLLTSSTTRGEVKKARAAFAEAALNPPKDSSQTYLFRHGIEHLIEAGQTNKALQQLCTFSYLMERLQTVGDPDGVHGISSDWRAIQRSQVDMHEESRQWEFFFREREHLLQRGNKVWPSYKILLQLAVEHADASPITTQAETWLQQGPCNWLWLRNPRRPSVATPNPCLRVFQSHPGQVGGACPWGTDQFLSWGSDGCLRLWSTAKTTPLACFKSHTGTVLGALPLNGKRFLSWSTDHTLKIWNEGLENPMATLSGHTGSVTGALLLSEDQVLSWSEDQTLRRWDLATGKDVSFPKVHKGQIEGVLDIGQERVISWSEDGKLCIWNTSTLTPLDVLKPSKSAVTGALLLSNGKLLSLSDDGFLYGWDIETGETSFRLDRHSLMVMGAIEVFGEPHQEACTNGLRGPFIISWSEDQTMIFWDVAAGNRIWTQAFETWRSGIGCIKAALLVNGKATLLRNGREILVWGNGPDILQIAFEDGASIGTMKGHLEKVGGVCPMSNQQVLSWSSDGTLRLWAMKYDAEFQNSRAYDNIFGNQQCYAGKITGSSVLSNSNLLTWGDRREGELFSINSLCEWSFEDGDISGAHIECKEHIASVVFCPDHRYLSYSRNGQTRLWDSQTRKQLASYFSVKEDPEVPTRVLLAASIHYLAVCTGNKIQIFNRSTGAPGPVLTGHVGDVDGVVFSSEGSLLSWSREESTARFWDLVKGTKPVRLDLDFGPLEGVMLLPHDRILTWSKEDRNCLRLWDARTGRSLRVFEAHQYGIKGVQILEDERMISWSSGERNLCLWSLSESEPLAEFSNIWGGIVGVQSLPGNRLAAWSDDGVVGIWLLETKSVFLFAFDLFQAAGIPSGKGCHILAQTLPLDIWLGWSRGQTCGTMLADKESIQAQWLCDEHPRVEALLPDGTLLARGRERGLSLKLYQGARRISFQEASEG